MRWNILYQIPSCLQRLYRGVVWREDTSQRAVYLTFDDGPVPEVTPKILDILDEYKVKATFFWVGENVSKYPDLAREVVARGHQVGNHTFHHLRGLKTSTNAYLEDIQHTEEICQQVLGKAWKPSHLFRPPHGRMSYRQKREVLAKYKVVLWDVLTHDYNPHYSPERIETVVAKYVRNGSVIVFHDSLKAADNTLTALPKVLTYLQQNAYTCCLLNK